MSATVLYMSMSLDGFIAGPDESLDNGLGSAQMALESLQVVDAPGATHLRYRVVK